LIHQQLHTTIPAHVAFQSRLGTTPWIKPYLDLELKKWHALGYKNIVITCPSFTTDCLETLEEIHIRFKEDWEKLTQGTVTTPFCLNDAESWTKTLASWIANKLTINI
jgi:ferrochelatase